MIRVYELAKELHLVQRDLVARIRALGYPVNNHMSQLDTESAERVREHINRERQENVEEVKVSKNVFRRRQKPKAPDAVPPTPRPDDMVQPIGGSWTAPASLPEPPPAPVPPPAPEPEVVYEAAPVHVEAPAAVQEAPIEQVAVAAVAAPVAAAAAVVDDGEQRTVAEPKSPRITQAELEAQRPAAKVTMPEPEELARRQAAIQAEQERKAGLNKRRGRSTITKKDLYADAARFQKGAQRKKKKVVAKKGQKTQLTTPKAAKRVVKFAGAISVGDLAKQMSIKAADVLKTLMGMGSMATINQMLDFDTAILIATEFEYEVQDVAFQEASVIETVEDVDEDLIDRAPVVTIMGHVDHGKTSLLDRIRTTDVASGEAGGITQHIGAYNVSVKGKGKVVFLDTPGHAAFTAMRARGAQCTDIVVLVVAADDGVMPQTLEAIHHSKDAGVPIIVAVNKIDRDNANPDRVRQAVSEHELVPEEWGGDTQYVNVSAKTGDGVDTLLEAILLQAEVLELKANPKRKARAAVIEARLETGRGAVSTVLVQHGTLKVGDTVVAGSVYGRIRAMNDEHGAILKTAGPSTPVEIIGLNAVPEAGDMLDVVKNEKDAKSIVAHRQEQRSAADLSKRTQGLQDISALLGQGAVKEVKVIVKADVQGSVEAVRDALVSLSTEKVKLTSIHEGVGGITESDVQLAAAANRDSTDTAVFIIGFSVRAPRKVVELAESEGVSIKHYDVIYDAVDELKLSMAGLLSPRLEERFMGRAEVRATFVIPKQGTVAGCMITDGKAQRNVQARLLRDEAVVWTGKLGSLRRFKDDVKEVQSGFECGIGLAGYNDIKDGDIIELFEVEEVAATLED